VEFVITKVVPNFSFFLHKFSGNFYHPMPIFPVLEIILNLFLFWNLCHVGPTCRSPSRTRAHVSEPHIHLVPRLCVLLHTSSPSCRARWYTAQADSSCPKNATRSALRNPSSPVASPTSFPCTGPLSPH
jgi:hypothetical protein